MNMDAAEAAKSLQALLKAQPWFTAVGVGIDGEGKVALFLYVSRLNVDAKAYERDGWNGYPVLIRKMGPLRPVSRPATLPVR